jgi:uncharacterized protein (TIGR04255 family)
MSRQMKNAPVYFTIAQVRFNPILSLSTFVPGIQEDFRKHDFADFKKAVAMAFSFGPLVGGQLDNQLPPPQPLERYIFSDSGNTKIFVLEHGALSFQSTRYEVFETFVAELMKGLEVVNKMVGGLSFVERVGLRYLDAVMPREGETLNQYLIPEALGLYGKLKGKTKHAFLETMAESNEGSLISRAIIQEGKIGVPPDLQLNELKISQAFTIFNGVHAILDTDAFHVERVPFDVVAVKKRLDVLHDRINEAFHALVTQHARDVWK